MSKASLHACLTFWHKHRTKVCCCSEAPSLIPRKATHLKRALHLHRLPVESHPKVLVDTSNPWYNWTILRKLPALALCSSASVPSPWLLLFLVASSFYEQTICAFQTAMLRPLTTSCFFNRNAIVSLNTDYLKKLEPKCLSMISTSSTVFFWICLKKCLSEAPSQKTFTQSNFSQQTTAKGHG